MSSQLPKPPKSLTGQAPAQAPRGPVLTAAKAQAAPTNDNESTIVVGSPNFGPPRGAPAPAASATHHAGDAEWNALIAQQDEDEDKTVTYPSFAPGGTPAPAARASAPMGNFELDPPGAPPAPAGGAWPVPTGHLPQGKMASPQQLLAKTTQARAHIPAAARPPTPSAPRPPAPQAPQRPSGQLQPPPPPPEELFAPPPPANRPSGVQPQHSPAPQRVSGQQAQHQAPPPAQRVSGQHAPHAPQAQPQHAPPPAEVFAPPPPLMDASAVSVEPAAAELAVAPAWQPPVNAAGEEPNTRIGRVYPDKIYRFRISERLLHWSFAIPFLTCIASAAVLVLIYNQHPDWKHRDIFSWAHRIAGLVLVCAPPLVMLRYIKDAKVYLANIREGWSWSKDDVKWLMLQPLTFISKKVELPEEGKFNAGEKMNFMGTMGSYCIMGVTGIIVWRDPLFLSAWFVHLATAAAVLPMVGGHMFMATINPSTRIGLSGMITGWVSRTWASHHYRRWYHQIISRHMDMHGKVPELDTLEHDEPHTDGTGQRQARLARLKWIISGTALGVAVAAGLGAAAWGLRSYLPQPQAVLDAAKVATVAQKLYITEEQPLLTKPGENADPAPGGNVLKGTQVTQLAELGDFVLVQDQQARAGYVKKGTLGAEVPKVSPGVEFPDCAAHVGETESTACEARAQALLTACQTGCPESRKAVCGDMCSDRFNTCIDGCKKSVAAPDDPKKKAVPDKSIKK